MSKYVLFCKQCGYVSNSTCSNPNEFPQERPNFVKFCSFCNTPMFSIDKSLEEYAADWETFTSQKLDISKYDEIKVVYPIIERDYTAKFVNDFDPAAKERRLATIEKNLADREARKRLPHCPKCRSTSIVTQKQGFGVGKAAAGVILTGGLLGAAAGGINANKNWNVCQKCGHKWKI